MREIDRALIAGDTDRGAVCAGHDVRAKPERFDYAHNIVDLALAGAGVHYDEHGVKSRLFTGNNTLRSNLTRSFRFCLDQNRRKCMLDFGPMLLVLGW